jgi:hypothetical protein
MISTTLSLHFFEKSHQPVIATRRRSPIDLDSKGTLCGQTFIE